MQNQRFSYVKYDEQAVKKQEDLKKLFEQAEAMIEANLPNGRAKSLVLTHLEESYMWTGKAIRDEQIERNSSTPHAVERSNQ